MRPMRSSLDEEAPVPQGSDRICSDAPLLPASWLNPLSSRRLLISAGVVLVAIWNEKVRHSSAPVQRILFIFIIPAGSAEAM